MSSGVMPPKKKKRESEVVTGYVVKYWETMGILKTRGVLIDGGLYFKQIAPTSGLGMFVGRRDYALTEEEARLRVDGRLSLKIFSTEKRLQRLRGMMGANVKMKEVGE